MTGSKIAVDAKGYVYVGGVTGSANLPAHAGFDMWIQLQPGHRQ